MDTLRFARHAGTRDDVATFHVPFASVVRLGDLGLLCNGLFVEFRRHRCLYTDRPTNTEASLFMGGLIAPVAVATAFHTQLQTAFEGGGRGLKIPDVLVRVKEDAKTRTEEWLTFPGVIFTEVGMSVTAEDTSLAERLRAVCGVEILYREPPLAQMSSPEDTLVAFR